MSLKILADSITRVRNALMVSHKFVVVPYSKLVMLVCEELEKGGYIHSYEKFSDKEDNGGFLHIKISLKYHKGSSVIKKIKYMCTGNKQTNMKLNDIEKYIRYSIAPGMAIFSTSSGIKSGYQAMQDKTGGRLLVVIE